MDCYDGSRTVPIWHSDITEVFKGNYQGRPVAVKVWRLRARSREPFMVSSIVTLDLPSDFFLTCHPEILRRDGGLETAAASKYCSTAWRYDQPRSVFVGFGLDG